MLAATEFISVRRSVEQNKQILNELTPLIRNRHIPIPSIIKDGLKNAQEKNHDVIILFMAHDMMREKSELSEEPILFFVDRAVMRENSRAKLIQLLDTINDFQELIRGHFAISQYNYIHEDRLDEIREIISSDFDLVKLVRLCEELNSAYQNENYISVAMLVRVILDHVPPIFGFQSFVEVSSQYGGKSLKKSLQNLQHSSRNIADAHHHNPTNSR